MTVGMHAHMHACRHARTSYIRIEYKHGHEEVLTLSHRGSSGGMHAAQESVAFRLLSAVP